MIGVKTPDLGSPASALDLVEVGVLASTRSRIFLDEGILVDSTLSASHKARYSLLEMNIFNHKKTIKW